MKKYIVLTSFKKKNLFHNFQNIILILNYFFEDNKIKKT